MKTFKAICIEDGFEFENYNDRQLFNHIINSYLRKEEKIRNKVSQRIGIETESESEFEIEDVFGMFGKTYENNTEINEVTLSELADEGFTREISENFFEYKTPFYILTVVFGKDFGGSECVKQIANITIIEKSYGNE